jgi:hypothetical protein
MLVPETSVNEDHSAKSWKDQVRFSRKIFAMKTESVPKAMRETSNDQLGLHSFAPDSAHVCAPALGCDFVHSD